MKTSIKDETGQPISAGDKVSWANGTRTGTIVFRGDSGFYVKEDRGGSEPMMTYHYDGVYRPRRGKPSTLKGRYRKL